MISDTPSSTAEAAAAVRALESLLPESKRLFSDDYSAAFLRRRHQALLSLCKAIPQVRNAVEKLLDLRFPGVPADFICRTHYIDRILKKAFIEGGLETTVILGAGYDMRAFRLGSQARSVKFVEVDHPATQRRKIAIAKRILSSESFNRTTWVAHDLVTPIEASERLREALDRPARRFWLAEGLLGYLPQETARALFVWIVRNSTAGSRFVFTYLTREMTEGRSEDRASQLIRKHLERAGEPFVSGWSPQEMGELCRSAGLHLEDDVSEAELARRYLAPLGRSLNVVKEFRIVSARVLEKK